MKNTLLVVLMFSFALALTLFPSGILPVHSMESLSVLTKIDSQLPEFEYGWLLTDSDYPAFETPTLVERLEKVKFSLSATITEEQFKNLLEQLAQHRQDSIMELLELLQLENSLIRSFDKTTMNAEEVKTWQQEQSVLLQVKIDKFIASWRQKISSSIGKDISPTVAESQVLSTIFWSGNTKLVSGLNSKKLSATLPSLKRKEWQNWLKEATQNRDKLQNTIQKYDDSVALYLEQIVAESGLIPEETEVSAENNSKSMEDFLALQKNVDELNGLLDPLLADCYNKLDQLETLKDKKEIWITLEQQLMLFTASLRHLNGELLNCQNSLLEISYMEKFRDKTKNVASHLPKLWMQRIAEQRLPQLTPLFTPVSKTDEIAISLELTAIKKIVDKLPKK